MRFESKRDAWIGTVLWAGTIAAFLAAVAAAVRDVEALPVVAAYAVLLFVSWVWTGTYYLVTDRYLLVRGGPFRWTIELEEIRAIRPARSPAFAPSLSLDRLEISYGVGKLLQVSPDDPDRFLEAIRIRRPDVRIGADGHD